MPANRLRGVRLQIMLAAEELTLVDDFRFKHRMPSRAAAVRELFRRGLASEGFQLAEAGVKSSEFGVSAAQTDHDAGRTVRRSAGSRA